MTMRKGIIITIITTIILLPVLFFRLGRFHFDDNYIIGQYTPFEKVVKIDCHWKYYDGCSNILGEALTFKNSKWEVKNDTIYFDKKPKIIVESLIYRYFPNDYILTIQSLDGQQTCSYVSK